MGLGGCKPTPRSRSRSLPPQQLLQEGFGQVEENFGPGPGKQRWSCCEQPAGCSIPGRRGVKPLSGVRPGTKALLS